ncbi:hypothetical protein AAMO2058_001736900 [Amorphochlora amoebiformis]
MYYPLSSKSSLDFYNLPKPSPEETERHARILRQLRIGLIASRDKAEKILGKTESILKSNGISVDWLAAPPSPPALETTSNTGAAYDILLHKIGEKGDKDMGRVLEERGGMRCLVIDPPHLANRAMNRIMHAKLCHEGLSDLKDVEFAASAVLNSSNTLCNEQKALAWLAKNGLRLPVIFKPLGPDADPHDLCGVFNPKGLISAAMYHTPAIVQQYIPHDAQRLYKVYILGRETVITQRQSLPLLNYCDENPQESQGRSNWHFGRVSKDMAVHAQPLDPEFVRRLSCIAERLRAIFGLRMLNFDAVLERRTNRIIIVDVNYFPGYQKCFNDFGVRFMRFLAEAWLDREQN